MGLPQRTIEWSRRFPSPSGVSLSFPQKIPQQADVIAIDLGVCLDPLRCRSMMRCRVEWGLVSAFGEHAIADIPTELVGGDSRDVGGKRQDLQIEHDLDMLFPGIGHTDRCFRQ